MLESLGLHLFSLWQSHLCQAHPLCTRALCANENKTLMTRKCWIWFSETNTYYNYSAFKSHLYDDSDLVNQKTETMFLKRKQRRKPTRALGSLFKCNELQLMLNYEMRRKDQKRMRHGISRGSWLISQSTKFKLLQILNTQTQPERAQGTYTACGENNG